MRRISILCITLLLLGGLFLTAGATEQTAEDITGSTFFSGGGLENYDFLSDGVDTEGIYISHELELNNRRGIAALSIAFDQPCNYIVRDGNTGASQEYGGQGFLHCFSNLEADFDTAPTLISVEFPQGAVISEMRVFSPGELPADVQRWEPPLTGGADIVLFSTHGDDEQLYFAGLLPYYAGEKGLAVQVVYMTDHTNNAGSVRMHEMLNGLWAVGVKAYPVFGYFPDFKLPYREHTYLEYERLGYSRAELLSYVVENLRRFRPQVAVGHDLNGEYGHGMHKVYADLLTQAVAVSGNPEAFSESAERYGAWDVPKTYLHLYKENEIIMDWDQPLEAFGGMTAFEVNQKLGFPCHASQQYGQYVYWLYGSGNSVTRATQISHYSPCLYGLYRTTVGEDVEKNNMMENLISYAEQSRLHEEQMKALRAVVEQAQLEQEQESKLLRSPDPTEPEIQEEVQEFPVAAAILALVSVAAAAVLYILFKKSEKK